MLARVQRLEKSRIAEVQRVPRSIAVDDVLTRLVRSSLFHRIRVRGSPDWPATLLPLTLPLPTLPALPTLALCRLLPAYGPTTTTNATTVVSFTGHGTTTENDVAQR